MIKLELDPNRIDSKLLKYYGSRTFKSRMLHCFGKSLQCIL